MRQAATSQAKGCYVCFRQNYLINYHVLQAAPDSEALQAVFAGSACVMTELRTSKVHTS